MLPVVLSYGLDTVYILCFLSACSVSVRTGPVYFLQCDKQQRRRSGFISAAAAPSTAPSFCHETVSRFRIKLGGVCYLPGGFVPACPGLSLARFSVTEFRVFLAPSNLQPCCCSAQLSSAPPLRPDGDAHGVDTDVTPTQARFPAPSYINHNHTIVQVMCVKASWWSCVPSNHGSDTPVTCHSSGVNTSTESVHTQTEESEQLLFPRSLP